MNAHGPRDQAPPSWLARPRSTLTVLLAAALLISGCKKKRRRAAPPPPPPAAADAGAAAAAPDPATDPNAVVWRGPPPQEVRDPYFLVGLNPTVPKALGTPAVRQETPFTVAQQRAALATLRKLIATSGAHLAAPGERTITPLRPPQDLARALFEKRAGTVHSLEAAAMLASGLKQAGANAYVCEVDELAGNRIADPTGNTGYFAVIDMASRTILDPLGGAVAKAHQINDQAAVAYFMALTARGLLRDPVSPANRERAASLIASASAMPASEGHPTFAALESTVVAKLGFPARAVAKAKAALALANDAPRHLVLSTALAAAGDTAGAERELDASLAARRLAPAVAEKASAAFRAGKPADGAKLLAELTRLAPRSATTALLRASFPASVSPASAAPAAAARLWAAAALADPDAAGPRDQAITALRHAKLDVEADALIKRLRATAQDPSALPQIIDVKAPASKAPAKSR